MFDRPQQPTILARGLDRNRPSCLIEIGLCLPGLLNRADVACQGEVLLEKLPSLTRLAVSAGVQKRTYLRGGASAREFLLERAAVQLVPHGLAIVLQQLLGVKAPTTKPARSLARKILQAIRSPFETERARTSLDLLLAAPRDPIVIDPAVPLESLAQFDEICDDLVSPEGRCAFVENPPAAIDWHSIFQFIHEKTSLTQLAVAHDARN